jgi:hypothetical protein
MFCLENAFDKTETFEMNIFLKALELKRLQTPLYMEYKSIHNVGGNISDVRTEGFLTPMSQSEQAASTSKSSASKASARSGLSVACSRESEASICSDSPGVTNNQSVNFCPHAESPRLNEWKGLLLETQQPLPSPRYFFGLYKRSFPNGCFEDRLFFSILHVHFPTLFEFMLISIAN